ncbi:alcohol dehydrogenase catalytic domain-containing protein [Nocardia tengchongensis]
MPVAEPGPGEVRVAVAAAPVNPTDLGVASGFSHEMGMINQPSHTGLGWDFAGTVVAAGPDVDLAVGTRVAGVVLGFDRDFGTYAEQLVVPAADLAVVPDELDLVAASTVPLSRLYVTERIGRYPEGREGLTGQQARQEHFMSEHPRIQRDATDAGAREALRRLLVEPTISIPDAARLLGIGRSTVYAAAKSKSSEPRSPASALPRAG